MSIALARLHARLLARLHARLLARLDRRSCVLLEARLRARLRPLVPLATLFAVAVVESAGRRWP